MSDDAQQAYDAAVRDLQGSQVLLDSVAQSLRSIEYMTEIQRRELVAWLDDLQASLQRTGQAFQRLNERTAAHSPLAGMNARDGAPAVIVHERGNGPHPS